MTRLACSGRGRALGAAAFSLTLVAGASALADLPVSVLGPGDKPVDRAAVWAQDETGAPVKAVPAGDGIYVLPGRWTGALDIWIEHPSSLPTAVCTLNVPAAATTATVRIADGVIAEFPWPKSPGRPALGPGPANDECANAIPIAATSITAGTTLGATMGTDPIGGTCVTGITAAGVWYSTVGTGNMIAADVCTADYDTKLFVFEDGCGTLTCVTGNDDACGLQSEVQWLTTPGVEYLVFVSGFGGATGNFSLALTEQIPPANDLPCNAEPLVLGTLEFTDNTFASADPGEVSPGAGSGSSCIAQDGWCAFETDVQNSVWYTFVAPPSGMVIVEADGCDLQLAVWEVGNCADYGTYVELAANDDSNPALFSPLIDAFACNLLTPGATYFVQLDGFDGAACGGTILVTDAAPGEVAADCNANGIADACDVVSGSLDCNMNGVPDECETIPACACATITIEIQTDDFGNETGWFLTDQGTGDVVFNQPSGLPNATLLTWDVSVSALGCYDFTITDSFGDGICCGFGNGGYTVSYEGVVVATGGTFAAEETVIDIGDCGVSPDCNANGIPDDCDILPPGDCGIANGSPGCSDAECEAAVCAIDPLCCDLGWDQACADAAAAICGDCNGNGIPDECDITDNTSADCNANGIPDECDIAFAIDPDCNGNLIPDSCDIAIGTSLDCQPDGIPDECQLVDNDCNNNGIPDDCDEDCNMNAVPDDCETALEPTAAQADGAADDCGDAPLICTGITYTGSTVGATADGPLSNCGGILSFVDVWYRYRPRWTGPAIFSTFGSTMPVIVEVWDGCPDAGGIRVDCASGFDTSAKVVVQIKQEYWIRLSGPGFDTTEYMLELIGPDCNLNPIDCNENMIPDECECIADVVGGTNNTGDGVVSYVDLAVITAAIGTLGGPYDLDGSGIVDENDQLFLLMNLGRCPFFFAEDLGLDPFHRKEHTPSTRFSPVAQ